MAKATRTMELPATIKNNMILHCTVGSNVYGLILDGTDDRDEMAVFIEPEEYVIGFHKLDTWVWRTQPEGHRSGPGDLDFIAHSLRKFLSLALKGNPTILIPLFANTIMTTRPGRELQSLAPAIISKNVGKAYLGYLQAQRMRLTGERGQKNVRRRELEAVHGYDTKYAMHALRLGFQGLEILSTGRLELPMGKKRQNLLMRIRRGHLSKECVLELITQTEGRLKAALTVTTLQDEPDYDRVTGWMITVHKEQWRGV